MNVHLHGLADGAVLAGTTAVDAFAGREPVRLDHDRRIHPRDEGLGFVQAAECAVCGGWHAGAGANPGWQLQLGIKP